MMLVPDPAIWQGTFETNAAGVRQASVKALGTGCTVPRVLRATGMVRLAFNMLGHFFPAAR